jgi:hypothetical protein
MRSDVSKGLFRCLTTLDKLGYYPINSNNDKVLYRSIANSLEQLGKSYSKALVSNMCELYGLSENELFTNYDFFKKTLYNTVGKGEANAILISIKKELLAQAILNGSNLTVREIINPKFSIDDILKKVNDSEVLKFITSIPSHEHILFLYANASSKDHLLSVFFYPGKTVLDQTDLLSVKPSDTHLAKKNKFYDELFEELSLAASKAELEEKLNDLKSKPPLFVKSRKKNMPARIAQSDATFWLEKGYSSELIILEQSIGKYTVENLTVLCGYNISRFADEDINTKLERIISFHGYVIIDEPLRVYAAEPNTIEVKKRKTKDNIGERSYNQTIGKT